MAALCLAATLSMIFPSPSLGVSSYDPLLDVNDDGQINIVDISKVAAAFRTSGTPINKTALLLGADAIRFNSTDSEIQVSTTETDYVDMPDMSVNLTLDRMSSVLIMFSTEATIGDAAQGIFIHVDVDDTGAVPSFVCVATPTNGTYYNAHSYNFYMQSVDVGTHTVNVLWKVTGGTGYVRNRTLVVMALPE